MANKKQHLIYTPTPTVKKMHDRLKVVDALLGGTASIHNNLYLGTGQRQTSMIDYIPKEVGEQPDVWRNRLLRTYVTPYFSNAVTSATGTIFRVPPTLSSSSVLDPRIKDLLDNNVDLEDADIMQYAMEAQNVAFAKGMAISVAFFYNPSGSDSLADQKETGARPYLKTIDPIDLLGFKIDKNNKVVMIRFREQVKASVDGAEEWWGDEVEERITVLTPTRFETYSRAGDKVYSSGSISRIDPYTGSTLNNEVPIKVLYGRKINSLICAPVFEDLAWINVHHTQATSDLSWSNHFSLIPFLFATLPESVDPKQFNIGTLSSSVTMKLPVDGNIKWIETTGVPQTQGRAFIKDIEGRMSLATMTSDVGAAGTRETATGRAIDANHVSAKLRLHAEAMESWLDGITELLCSFYTDLDSVPKIKWQCNKDFEITVDNSVFVQLTSDVVAGRISWDRYLTECKRRGVYSEDLDVMAEIEKMKAAGIDINKKTKNEISDSESDPESDSNDTEE